MTDQSALCPPPALPAPGLGSIRNGSPALPRPSIRFAAAVATALLMASPSAFAARPMITDDARIVDPKSCQLETWVQSFREQRTDYWALPGCNPLGWFELTLGGAYEWRPGTANERRLLAQFKTLFRTLEPGGVGWGVSIGTLDTWYSPKRDALFEPYVNVPISASLADDQVILHINVGAVHVRGQSGWEATWGIGTEIYLNPRVFFIAETFGRQGNTTAGQFGVRYWVVPNRVQIDATLGTSFESPVSAYRWVSIGLRLLSPPFLP